MCTVFDQITRLQLQLTSLCFLFVRLLLQAKLQLITERLAELCSKRGVMFKSFFDDCAKGEHSAKVYGHVTVPQFKQCLSVKVRLNEFPMRCVLAATSPSTDSYPCHMLDMHAIHRHVPQYRYMPSCLLTCSVRQSLDMHNQSRNHQHDIVLSLLLVSQACIRLSKEDYAILVEKYFHDDFPEVRLAKFRVVDPVCTAIMPSTCNNVL